MNPESLLAFVDAKMRSLGTSACPPYHLAVVIGGTSAEQTLKVAKLASARYLDTLPAEGNKLGRGFRDRELEAKILEMAQKNGIGAQFGGKYFCHDVRVIRLPRHGASCPVGIAVSCSADRQALGKITREGVFLEQLEMDPAKYLPETTAEDLEGEVVKIDLRRPMSEIRAELSRYPIRTRLSLSGPLIVARDIAHAKIKERLDRGEGMPEYLKDYMVYYAGPAKTPAGYASGSFGPTTAGRMDAYVDAFQSQGGSLVMLAKGNRSQAVTAACKKHGGFYLGSIGGPAARLARTASPRSTSSSMPSWGWKRCGRLRSTISRRSSSSTTRGTISSRGSTSLPGRSSTSWRAEGQDRAEIRIFNAKAQRRKGARRRRRSFISSRLCVFAPLRLCVEICSLQISVITSARCGRPWRARRALSCARG